MLRTILASAAALALTAGAAHAQGAADVGEYHERFAIDSDPTDRAAEPGFLDRLLGLPDPVFDDSLAFEETLVISSPEVVSRSPAAIPQTGLTPGAPLGTDPMTDEKAVTGERR